MVQLDTQSHSWLHSFCIRPDVHFDIQHENEEVLLVVRKHPFTQIPWIFNTSVLVLLAFFLGTFILSEFLLPNQILVFYLFSGFFIFSYMWVNLLLWYFTVGIVTNERIVDLDFYNIIYKEYTATTVNQVSDISTTIGGFFGSILHFGDVFVKTEGFQQNIEFLNVPEPSQIVQIINQIMRDLQVTGSNTD